MAATDLAASNLRAAKLAPLHRMHRALPGEFFRAATAFAAASFDFLASALGMLAVFSLSRSLPMGAFTLNSVREALSISTAFGLLVAVLIHQEGGYRGGNGLLRIQQTERAIRISVQSLLLVAIFGALWGRGFPWRSFLVASATIPLLLVLEKQSFTATINKLMRKNKNMSRAVIYGSGDAGRSLVSTLLESPNLGFDPVAVVGDRAAHFAGSVFAMGYRNRKAVEIRTEPLSPSLLRSLRCALLLVAVQDLSPHELASARDAARQAGADFAFMTGRPAPEHRTKGFNLDELQFTSDMERRDSLLYAAAKRAADVVVSIVLLVLLAPLLFLIAILIRLDSPGPALLVQRRTGRNGELFQMFKFRSMYRSAPKYARSPKSSHDPRITRIGRLLRRLNLDELPQLLNVLMGSMSLVGPRPEMPFIVEQYNPKHRERLQVIPGITGLWQLSGDRAFPIHQNIEYDLYYIRNRGFFMDLAILAHTLMFAMCGGI
jgi:exopolysaccharide biosynthesis polyprenyl glycosylphosphotransferase